MAGDATFASALLYARVEEATSELVCSSPPGLAGAEPSLQSRERALPLYRARLPLPFQPFQRRRVVIRCIPLT